MKRFVWLLVAFVPLGTGLVVGRLFETGTLENRVIVARYAWDLARIASVVGALSTVLTLVSLTSVWLRQRTLVRIRQAEQLAQAANRRQFLRRLDHELKNPLTIIRLGVSNLQDSAECTAGQASSLQRIGNQAERLQKLIEDLRWLAELEQQRLEQQPLDVRALIDDVVESSAPDMRDHTLDVQTQEVPWPVGKIRGDRDLLAAALRNVVGNALKYTTDIGHVTIRATDDGRQVTIEVADNGIGIPDDEIEHVFEELYRGQNAKQVPGSGMGLALVRKIVALHGGNIDIRSREGQGSVVTLRLPLATD
jgi:two-component system OmpR family sensor kinase